MDDTGRPACYPPPAAKLGMDAPPGSGLPLLDVLTSPVPQGRFDSPVDHRHVLCLHLGNPVPVSYRADGFERRGTRLHGQFCVVPAGSSTRWTLSSPAESLLLRVSPELMRDGADGPQRTCAPAPAIHIRDAQIERIGWMMQSESRDSYPSGRLFSDALGCALVARLRALQSPRALPARADALPQWRLARVVDYIEANLDADLSLAELAAVAGFSVSHFKAMFRNAAGMPAHRFVMRRRVERAHSMLMQRGASTTEVALATGFAHASHMARCMRRVLGIDPARVAPARAKHWTDRHTESVRT